VDPAFGFAANSADRICHGNTPRAGEQFCIENFISPAPTQAAADGWYSRLVEAAPAFEGFCRRMRG